MADNSNSKEHDVGKRMTRRTYVALCLTTLSSGCVNTLVMFGKTFLGDPTHPSGFEQATGVSLKDDEKSVLLICSATSSVNHEFGEVPIFLEEELMRRLKRRDISVVDQTQAIRIIEDRGGQFDATAIAKGVDGVDYIVHIKLDYFSYMEHESPNLYRGRSGGIITAYEVRGGDSEDEDGKERKTRDKDKDSEASAEDSGPRFALQVYTQEFRTEYPTTHPIPVDDNMPKSVFIRRAMEHLATSLGATFYDVTSSELITD